MMKTKLAYVATTALVGSLLMAGSAFAQSTGTNEVEAVEVTAASGPNNIEGLIVAETAPKSKSTVDQEFIAKQASGQTVIETLNLTPGLNFTSSDAYGSSGGNLRLRGFDGARVSLTFDGMPLNDTGNYAIYTNQQLDSELISRATVNMGTTDVDSPTASATGGTINYVTRRPGADMGGLLTLSAGEENYGRIFGMFETGEFGPWGTAAFAAASYQKYDKFKGPGDLEKQQFNGRIYQPMGDNGDFLSIAFHYNENRNAFYRNPTLAQFNTDPYFENDRSCTRPTPVNGTVQNDNTQSTFVTYNGVTGTGSCTNFFGTRINPSNTGNIRGQAKFTLSDSLTLTVDPSFQYTLANGGGYGTFSERDDRLDRGGAVGVDLNGDGDTLDTVALYTPNTTNTRRYGVTASLIWQINDTNRLRFAYTGDFGEHRQTGDYGFYSINSVPQDVFGGKDGYGRRVEAVDGASFRGRDRLSLAILNQVAVEYRGEFMDERLLVQIGLRAPFFKRELNQFCYSQNGTSTVRCTTEAPTVTLANGNVQFASTGATQFIAPYKAEVKFEDVLPNVGVSYEFAENQFVYLSYAEGLSAPRTDNLYTPLRLASGAIALPDADPETTRTWDLGYRYQGGVVIAQAALWKTSFENYILTAFDDTLGISVDRNVGAIESWGFDAQLAWEVTDTWTLYGFFSYTQAELQDNIPLSLTTALPTRGKTLVETPEYMGGVRTDWEVTENFRIGLQGKYVGNRFSTDVNDEETPSYMRWDFDARYNLPWLENTYLQFNITNLFDEEYFSSIQTTRNNAKTVDVDLGPGVNNRAGLAPVYVVGAPRTFQVTFRTEF